MRRLRGFTLVELMVTIAIAAVLMLVAAPTYMDARRNALLSDTVDSLVSSAASARAAALKSGRDAYVQVLDAGVGWRSGWVVYVDNNWNEQFDAGTDEMVLRQEALPTEVTVGTSGTSTLSSGYIRYIGSGFPRSKSSPAVAVGGALSMETSSRKINITLEPAGRLRSCRAGSTGC
jgi:type IV fimbrial biogenesis protein FimT